MRIIPATALAATLAIATAVPAAAQTGPQARSADPGRIEIGAVGSGLAAVGGGVLAAGPQVTVRLSRRHAIQLAADTHYDRWTHGWHVDGLYTALYRYTFAERGADRGFLLVGGAGGIELSAVRAHSYSQPAYSYTSSSTGLTTHVAARTYEYPAHSDFDLSVPVALVIGAGAESQVARHLVLQGQLGLGISPWGVGARASVGLSVPIGRVAR
jgi:hypothetical protein